MNFLRAIFASLILAVTSPVPENSLDWVYHDDDDELDDRATERVPGELFNFLAPGPVQDRDDITLYVLAPHRDENDRNNLLDVRWWNGRAEHWVRATWQKDIPLGEINTKAGRFHGLPRSGATTADLWKIVVPAAVTLPGDNYYFFRFRVANAADEAFSYVVRADSLHDNNLGQAWSPVGDVYGRDWLVTIEP
jgi:hypothetical protein